MAGRKSRIISFTVLIAAAILLLLGVLYLFTKSFVINVILHIFVRLLLFVVSIQILKKCLTERLADRLDKVLMICGCVIVADLVIVDGIRYILSSGTSVVFFLPVCLPICFMIIMSNSVADAGVDKHEIKRSTYLVGIPLLLLSLYFEVLSFL